MTGLHNIIVVALFTMLPLCSTVPVPNCSGDIVYQQLFDNSLTSACANGDLQSTNAVTYVNSPQGEALTFTDYTSMVKTDHFKSLPVLPTLSISLFYKLNPVVNNDYQYIISFTNCTTNNTILTMYYKPSIDSIFAKVSQLNKFGIPIDSTQIIPLYATTDFHYISIMISTRGLDINSDIKIQTENAQFNDIHLMMNTTFTLGGICNKHHKPIGAIDQLRIYDRLLTEQENRDIYNTYFGY